MAGHAAPDVPRIPRNAVGLVFGEGVQDGLGVLPYPFGTAIHLALALTSSSHPDHLDSNVVVGGFLCHVSSTVSLALAVKRRLG